MKNHSTEILLINSNLMKPPVSPVAIDFLASALRTEGYAVRFLDLAFENDIDSAVEREIERDFLFIGITVRNIDDSFFATRDFCLAKVRPIVQKIKSLTDAPVVLGGVGYSIFPIPALEYCAADFGIRGDGEVAIVRLADAFAKNGFPSHIPGLLCKGERVREDYEPVPVDLSAIDLSDRSTVDNLRYFNEGGMVGFETKRGCDASCSYCADPLARGTACRQRPPGQVAREIASLADIGIDHFHTCDSEFNVPYSHAVEICRAFIRTGLGERIRWYAYMTPAYFDDELAFVMKRAGCMGIDFGADHCNAALLKVLGRSHTADSLVEASRICRKHEIACMFDLLLGAPGETPDTLREVVEFMKRINPSCVGASMGVRIYPGTAMARLLAPRIQQHAPGLYGTGADNAELLRPAYFLSPDLGENPYQLLCDLVKGDERFFVPSPERGGSDYNYNDNSVLSEAIRRGGRGAFWDILRRLKGKEEPN
ncbi:MAG: radical SAM protein [Candidatus Hydrogenedentota bacterium]|nr:MAG: radical SAM protein [Candidatus Hydrogenedentota bacterium]